VWADGVYSNVCTYDRLFRVHKTANVLHKVPRSVQPNVEATLHEIWVGENREAA
jgi:transposase-like protein